MAEIAGHAEVNEVTIYRLFGSKEGLFNSVIRYALRVSECDLCTASCKSLESALRFVGSSFTNFMIDNVPLIKMQLNHLDMKALKEAGNSLFFAYLDFLKGFFVTQKGLSEREAMVEASCFLSFCKGLFMEIYVSERLSKDIPFETYMDTIISKYK